MRTRGRGQLAVLLLAMAGFAVSGCGDGPSGQSAVSGTVNFKGQPLDQGTITFMPLSKETPTQSGTGIKNGKYEIPKDKGLAPGKYRVSISSGDGKTPDPSSDAPPGPSGNFSSKERIPAKYNTESTQDVEVTRSGPNKFDFDIN